MWLFFLSSPPSSHQPVLQVKLQSLASLGIVGNLLQFAKLKGRNGIELVDAVIGLIKVCFICSSLLFLLGM
jgi:hypothetical protein